MDAKTTASMVRKRVAQAANVSEVDRILTGFRHSGLSMQVVADGIRRQHPQAAFEEICQLSIERIELMRRLELRHEHL